MLVLENIAVEEHEQAAKRHDYLDPLEAVDLMKVAYNSSVWVVCSYVISFFSIVGWEGSC